MIVLRRRCLDSYRMYLCAIPILIYRLGWNLSGTTFRKYYWYFPLNVSLSMVGSLSLFLLGAVLLACYTLIHTHTHYSHSIDCIFHCYFGVPHFSSNVSRSFQVFFAVLSLYQSILPYNTVDKTSQNCLPFTQCIYFILFSNIFYAIEMVFLIHYDGCVTHPLLL